MLKLGILFFIIVEVFGEDPIINLPNGKIRGKLVKSPVNTNFFYYAYQGIPFAAPPTGNLRFQPPHPVQNWEGIKDVVNNYISCYQTDREEAHATEDCLYLSVYTPMTPSNLTGLDVLVFIYGGSFIHGHMDYGYGKTGFLIEEGVVLVNFNYRVGPLGFLSTGDTVISGNMGLKDQQFALKWVQQNIHLFGGDPNKVTIMGQSAGSASVTYHLLSPGSADFYTFLNEVQNSQHVEYVQLTGKKHGSFKDIIYFKCNRSGKYKTPSISTRIQKLQGISKMNRNCTSEILLTVNKSNGFVNAVYFLCSMQKIKMEVEDKIKFD